MSFYGEFNELCTKCRSSSQTERRGIKRKQSTADTTEHYDCVVRGTISNKGTQTITKVFKREISLNSVNEDGKKSDREEYHIYKNIFESNDGRDASTSGGINEASCSNLSGNASHDMGRKCDEEGAGGQGANSIERRAVVYQVITSMIDMVLSKLEFFKPETLTAIILMQEYSFREPLRIALKLLMQTILKDKELSKTLKKAIEDLRHCNVRQTLKSSKRNQMPKTAFKPKKAEQQDNNILKELKRNRPF